MPQAPEYLRNEFADDVAAHKVLAQNFEDRKGLIVKKNHYYVPTAEENRAIDYLCLEWDYGYTAESPFVEVVCKEYCGALDWTKKKYGKILHKHSCKEKGDCCQSHPEGCAKATPVGK